MKSSWRADFLGLFFLLSILIVSSQAAYAQIITESQELDFGRIILSDFNTAADLTIGPTGTITKDPTIHIMIAPRHGIYTFTGGPAVSVYTVTFDPSINLSHGGVNFLVDTFTTAPPGPLMTNNDGEGTFSVGATLHSQGGGQTYSDGNYSGSLDITVNF